MTQGRATGYAVAVVVTVCLALVCLVPRALAADGSSYTNQCPDPASFTAEAAIASAESCMAIAERVQDAETTAADAAGLNHGDIMVLIGVVAGAAFIPPLFLTLFGGRR